MRSRHLALFFAVAVLASGLVLASGNNGATAFPRWEGLEAKDWPNQPRLEVPEDRYAMAGGCYTIAPAGGAPLTRESTTYTVGGAAEPFRFQATDLGSYLLFDSQKTFLAASEGVVGEAVYGASGSHPGQIASGVGHGQGDVPSPNTDGVADQIARSPVNEASGRGASVVVDDAPSNLADWKVTEASNGTFAFDLPETGQSLAVEGNELVLKDAESGSPFELQLTDGCAAYPEVEVNVQGPVMGGETSHQAVRGYLDAHLHMMAFEFLGGRARCGRPWHRFGVQYALVDCPDHEPGGHGAVLESVLTKNRSNPVTGHSTDGWPSFEGWPVHWGYTHEQVYYKWLERAWRGGLRMFTNLLVDNGQLCKIYPFKRNSCNEMDGVRLQARRINQLQDYIDAQWGGPGEGWFRIVTDPFEAREVINDGKLAVVLGIEVSVPLDCGEFNGAAACDKAAIDKGIDEVWDLGVRQMELVNKFDNALSGVAGDSGDTGMVVNVGNRGETGHFWRMETCTEADGHAHDKHQRNVQDETPEFEGRDPLVGAIMSLTGPSGVAPLYPKGPHCNIAGLTDLGEHIIKRMAEKGMLFDPDHMSARAQTQALNLLEGMNYPGVVSSHSWSNDTIYPRVHALGGVVTPYAGSSEDFVHSWRHQKLFAAGTGYDFGIGYGSDMNGFGSQGGPRSGDNAVQYPFEGFGGVTVNKQQSGTKTYDYTVDGVAHYGMYADWVEDLRLLAGDAIVEDLSNGPEVYLQMWERAMGIAPDSCRSDVADLTNAQLDSLQRGMSAEQVVKTLGQPSTRGAEAFTYCVEGNREATLTFRDEALHSWRATRSSK